MRQSLPPPIPCFLSPAAKMPNGHASNGYCDYCEGWAPRHLRPASDVVRWQGWFCDACTDWIEIDEIHHDLLERSLEDLTEFRDILNVPGVGWLIAAFVGDL